MQKRFFFILSAALALTLCACSNSSDSTAPAPTPPETLAATHGEVIPTADVPVVPAIVPTVPPTVATAAPPTDPAPTEGVDPEAALAAYRKVLCGIIPFLDSQSSASLTLEPNSRAIADAYGNRSTPCRFLLLDLDGDGLEELLLWLRSDSDNNAGFWALRFSDEIVRGYFFPSDSFEKLKSDGAFLTGDNPYNTGIGRVEFSASGWDFRFSARYKAALDGEGNVAVYYAEVGGQEATLEQYQAAYNRHLEKPSAVWLELDPANLAQAGLMESSTAP